MSNEPVTASATDPSPSRLIADRSYRNYDGPLRTIQAGWWVIAQAVLRTNVRKIGFWVPVIFIIIIHLAIVGTFYFTHNLSQVAGNMGPQLTFASTIYLCVTESWLMIFIEALIVGASAIAADTQANALLVYLSRPLTKWDYLLGKWLGVFLLLWAVTAIPSVLAYLYLLCSYYDDGFLKNNPYLFPRMLVAGLIAPALHASLILGFSAWSRSGRVAGVAYSTFFFVFAMVSLVTGLMMAENAYKDQDRKRPGADAALVRAITVRELSVGGVTDGLSMNLLHIQPQDNPFRVPPRKLKRQRPPQTAPLLLFGGLLLIAPLVATRLKVRAVEVVQG